MPKNLLLPIEPKYSINADTGRIVNRASGNSIPEDEPLMLFRAQDRHLPAVLEFYAQLCTSGEADHKRAIELRLNEIQNWQANNPLRVKTPDTVLDESWPGHGDADTST